MLKDIITLDCIDINLKGTTKSQIIDEMIDILYKAGKLNDREEYKKEILKRESQGSTGMEEGIAIPHAKTNAVKTSTVAIGISKKGVDYESLDGEPSHIFFMIAASDTSANSHIEILSKITTLLLEDEIREGILHANSKEELLNILIDNIEKEESVKDIEDNDNSLPQVLAVTACPTGIAHTYMAADSLTKKAKEMGINIKVETNGSGGIKNELNEEEIKNAKGIIVAADKIGLSFITEGAIPFAASDPIRVIPSCIIGAMISGGLSMAFNIELRAPHGGLFVLPIVNHPFLYLITIVVGSIITALILGFIKKPINE